MAHNKFLPRVLAAAAAMMLLAGCGSKADPGFSPSNPVNITIWTYYNGEQLEAFNALVDEFNSTVGKEQGITVESSSHGSVTDLENNVLASAEGKVGAEAMPNIFSAYADTAYALDEMGQIADLSDYLSEEDRAAFIEDYLSEGDFDYAVQQGAGMVVTKASDAEIQASLVFLKWFTSPEHNITFSVDSGYLPVTHEGNSIDTIRTSGLALSDEMDEVLSAAVDTVNENHLYTPRAFSGGTNARAILEYSMSDKASADRTAVKEAMAQGQSFEEASAQFLSDECFEAWYQDTLASLEAFQG